MAIFETATKTAVLAGAALFAAEGATTGVSDIPRLILNEGVGITIVTMFIVGQWQGRIVFVNKDQQTKLDHIQTTLDRIETKVQ